MLEVHEQLAIGCYRQRCDYRVHSAIAKPLEHAVEIGFDIFEILLQFGGYFAPQANADAIISAIACFGYKRGTSRTPTLTGASSAIKGC